MALLQWGPRSHERGNEVMHCAAGHPWRLQWGRVLMNAETFGLDPSSRTKGPLQWGRVLMNAETNGCNSHTDTDHCQLRIGTTLSRVVTSAL